MGSHLHTSGFDTEAERKQTAIGAGEEIARSRRRNRSHCCQRQNCEEKNKNGDGKGLISGEENDSSGLIQNRYRGREPIMKSLKCMYTNLDSFNSKRSDFHARVSLIDPDIIGIVEVNPKNAMWNLSEQDIHIQGYTIYKNMEGRGVV